MRPQLLVLVPRLIQLGLGLLFVPHPGGPDFFLRGCRLFQRGLRRPKFPLGGSLLLVHLSQLAKPLFGALDLTGHFFQLPREIAPPVRRLRFALQPLQLLAQASHHLELGRDLPQPPLSLERLRQLPVQPLELTPRFLDPLLGQAALAVQRHHRLPERHHA